MLKMRTQRARSPEKKQDNVNESFEVVAEERKGRPKMHFIVHSIDGKVVDKSRIMLPSPKNPFFKRRFQDAAE